MLAENAEGERSSAIRYKFSFMRSTQFSRPNTNSPEAQARPACATCRERGVEVCSSDQSTDKMI